MNAVISEFQDQMIELYSLQRAAHFYEKDVTDHLSEIGTMKDLCDIHRFVCEGIVDNAGEIRTTECGNKSGMRYLKASFIPAVIPLIDAMPQQTPEEIIRKFEEMILIHPFRDGNGRSCRIWMDMMLIRNLNLKVNWNAILHSDYLYASTKSSEDDTLFLRLIKDNLVPVSYPTSTAFKLRDYLFSYQGKATCLRHRISEEEDEISLHFKLRHNDESIPFQEDINTPLTITIEGKISHDGNVEVF